VIKPPIIQLRRFVHNRIKGVHEELRFDCTLLERGRRSSRPFGGYCEMENRITTELATVLNDLGPTRLVEVVVELRSAKADKIPGLSRKDQIKHAKNLFSANFDAVKQNIQQLGGEVLDSVWLNQTILASVPAGQVPKLASSDNVNLVDLPHALRLESA
jgi:hypothetical protein